MKRLNEEEDEAAWHGYTGEVHRTFENFGKPGDPTGRRAVRLVETDELRQAVELVRRFIGALTNETEQRTIIGIWRTHSVSIDWAAKGVGLTVPEMMATWSVLVYRLEGMLRDAGITVLELSKSHLGLPVPVGGRGDNP